jgi:hypothetical protein
MKLSNLILPAIALGAAAVLLTPGSSDAYSTIGGSLSQNQRDFRTFNNFTDAGANNNQVAHAQFPGAQGAVMAIWKATIEWGSELHGSGTGDTHQPSGLGSGGANFDPSHQGESTGVGNSNSNIHSELSGSQGGVLAFTETPISDGWRIRYYSSWSWADGPGTSISGTDLQGVACHEYGHALGLGHSTSGSATMFASISGSGVGTRSIATDDMNGVQAIYGSKSGTKPHISSTSVTGNQVTVTGTGFDGSGNQIWFTQKNAGGTGTPVKVTGLSSGGTSLTATIPANAGPGDILVRRNSTAHAGLSNAFPTDLAGTPGGGGAPVVSTITPSSVEAVVIDGPQTVVLTGSNFTGTTTVIVDGITLAAFPPQFTVSNDNTLSFSMPLVTKLGTIDIDLVNASGTSQTTIQVVSNTVTTVEMKMSEPAFLFQGIGLETVLAGDIGDIIVLLGSTELLPTNLPGIVDLAIGNNFTSLFILNTSVIPAKGYVEVVIPMSGLPSGLQVHTQGAGLLLSNGFALPATPSNVQTGTILF